MTGYPETGPPALKRFLPRAKPFALCDTHHQGLCPRSRRGGSLVLSLEIAGYRILELILSRSHFLMGRTPPEAKEEISVIGVFFRNFNTHRSPVGEDKPQTSRPG